MLSLRKSVRHVLKYLNMVQASFLLVKPSFLLVTEVGDGSAARTLRALQGLLRVVPRASAPAVGFGFVFLFPDPGDFEWILMGF